MRVYMISYLTVKKDIAVIKSSEIGIEPEIFDISTSNLDWPEFLILFSPFFFCYFPTEGSCDKETLYGAEIL